jgi:ureidoglycolate lyase
MTTLTARPITNEAFALYGWLAQAGKGSGRPINTGSSQRWDAPGALSLDANGGQACLAIFHAQARDPLGPWRVLERHRLGTQTFVPMGGARCVMLVATGVDQPDPHTLAAFIVAGDRVVTLHAGTWHHGLIALDAGDFAVIERQAPQTDCELAELVQAVSLVTSA